MDNIEKIVVELENEKLNFEAIIVEKKENSVIVFFSTQYARDIEDNELRYKNIFILECI